MFLKQKVDAAQGFINAVKQRQHTLLTTMQAIIDIQQNFETAYQELNLKLKNGFGIILRAYDEGVEGFFGIVGIWFGVLADQMSRFIFATIRFKQGKWVKIKI